MHNNKLISYMHVYTLQWPKTNILEYLEQWETAVAAREGFSNEEKSNMLLSTETSTGMKLTGIASYVNS